IREFRAPKSPLFNLAFSSDGKQLAATCSSTILIFEVAGGKPPRQIEGTSLPHALRFCSDDKRLLVTEFLKAVTSVDLGTGKPVKQWKPPAEASDWLKKDEWICRFFMSADEKFIAWF